MMKVFYQFTYSGYNNMTRILNFFTLFLLSIMPMFADDETRSGHLVDLGLPSGTLWLDHNLGASKSYDFGEYYLGTKNNSLTSLLGNGYYIPSREQFQELMEYTTQSWTEQSGIKGMMFTASNGNSIFLPAAAQLWYNRKEGEPFWDINNEGSGAYWTCTPSDDDYIYFVEFNKEDGVFFGDRKQTDNRLPLRPVYNPVSCTVNKSSDGRYVGKTVYGFSADGFSELKITYKSPNVKLDNTVDIKFHMPDNMDNENLHGSIMDIKYYTDSINIILQAPIEYLAESDSYNVTISITPSSSGKKIQPGEFTYSVYRPGVLFFHGLGDNSSLFDIMKNSILQDGAYAPEQLLAVDYSSSNTSSFEVNTHNNHVVRNGCYKLQDIMFDELGVICSRFDMVGHSMGGILIRLFVQEDNGTPFTNKILTLNTPHFGSELGNVATWAGLLNEQIKRIPFPNMSQIYYSIIYNLLINSLFRNDKSLDALKDLSLFSDAISNLNGVNSSHIKGIPIHSICSSIPEIGNGKFEDSSPFIFPQLFSGIIKIKRNIDNFLGDGVVPLYSQQGGLTTSSTTYSGDIKNAFHCNSPKWESFTSKVNQLLTETRNSSLFSLDGFGSLDTNPIKQSSRADSEEYLNDLNPVDSNKSVLSLSANIPSENNKQINIKLTKSDDIIYSFILGLTDNNEIMYIIDTIDAKFDMSKYDFNEVTFYAVGKTDYDALLIDKLSIDRNFNISGIANIDSDRHEVEVSTINKTISINSINGFPFTVSLFNISGQLILNKKGSKNVTITGISNGVYILNVLCNNGIHSYKILI